MKKILLLVLFSFLISSCGIKEKQEHNTNALTGKTKIEENKEVEKTEKKLEEKIKNSDIKKEDEDISKEINKKNIEDINSEKDAVLGEEKSSVSGKTIDELTDDLDKETDEFIKEILKSD